MGALFPCDLLRIHMASRNVFALELVIISKHMFNNLGLGNAGFCDLVFFLYFMSWFHMSFL